MKSVLVLSIFMTVAAQAQDMSSIDNQCRVEAKDIAVKSYQSCVTTARTARLEQIRKEYQNKLAEVKKQYEQQLQELKKQNSANSALAPVTVTQPTVVLKKAPTAKVPSKKTKASKTATAANSAIADSIITETELDKSAPATLSEPVVVYETNEVTGETENLQIVDPTLSPATE